MKNGPILLIDDDKDECELIRDALTKEQIHHELICFSNGLEAIAFLKTTSTKPFLILTDMNMPVMNGLELRQRINDDAELRRKSIPFVFLTTSATQRSVETAYDMSVQGFFEKGNNMQDIGTLLKEICSYWQRCRHPNN